MSNPEPTVELDLDEVRAEMTERGQLEFELAQLRATNKKLAARVREEAGGRLKAEAALEQAGKK